MTNLNEIYRIFRLRAALSLISLNSRVKAAFISASPDQVYNRVFHVFHTEPMAEQEKHRQLLEFQTLGTSWYIFV